MAREIFAGLGKHVKNNALVQKAQEALLRPGHGLAQLAKRLALEYEAIGKKAVELDGAERFGELGEALTKTQREMESIRQKIEQAERERAARAHSVCPDCTRPNPVGAKFCQECGRSLTVVSKHQCPDCGRAYEPEANFCVACGALLETIQAAVPETLET